MGVRSLRPILASLAALSVLWSVGAELAHDHFGFEPASLECSVDHDRASDERSGSTDRVTKAGPSHPHVCIACRTGHQRSLAAPPLDGVPAGEVTGEAAPVLNQPHVRTAARSWPSLRGPPWV